MTGERLLDLRLKKHLSQKEIAEKLNVSYTTYGDYERNESEPSFSTLLFLSNFYGVSIDYLIKGDDKNKKQVTFTKEEVDKLIDVINILNSKLK